MGFRWNGGSIARNLGRLDDQIDKRLDVVFHYETAHGAGYMKSNAPWTDRTGAARNGLYTEFSKHGSTREILFSHSVAYGIWLEVANSGDYQIILPSIRVIGRDTMEQLRDLFGDIR